MIATLLPCLAAHVNFPHAIQSAAYLRYVYHRFQAQGYLVYWNDYLSKAGFQHHSSRSMGVFAIADEDSTGNKRSQLDMDFHKQKLWKDLSRIVGVVLPQDWERLQSAEVGDIKPVFSKLGNKKGSAIRIDHATIEDPFFRITEEDSVHFSNNDVRIDQNYAIPMVVKVQDLR